MTAQDYNIYGILAHLCVIHWVTKEKEGQGPRRHGWHGSDTGLFTGRASKKAHFYWFVTASRVVQGDAPKCPMIRRRSEASAYAEATARQDGGTGQCSMSKEEPKIRNPKSEIRSASAPKQLRRDKRKEDKSEARKRKLAGSPKPQMASIGEYSRPTDLC